MKQVQALPLRASSGEVLNALTKQVPFFYSVGLLTLLDQIKQPSKIQMTLARELRWQKHLVCVREFAMGAALNGMALHGGLRVFGGTSLFSQTT